MTFLQQKNGWAWIAESQLCLGSCGGRVPLVANAEQEHFEPKQVPGRIEHARRLTGWEWCVGSILTQLVGNKNDERGIAALDKFVGFGQSK